MEYRPFRNSRTPKLTSTSYGYYESADNRKESRGAHARDDYKERNDEDWLFHTLAWLKDNDIKMGSRPVTLRAMSNEVQSFPPKARVY